MVSPLVEVDDVKVYWESYGDGIPLILLHGGMGFDSSYFKVPGILDLEKEGIKVILYDQRGHGKSERCDPRKYTHEVWLEDLARLTQKLGLKRFNLLGHSYGGYLAQEFAVNNPKGLEKLILISTSPGPINTSKIPLHESDESLKEDVRGKWPKFFFGEDKHWELFEGIKFSSVPFNAAFHRELKTYDMRDKLDQIGVKTLIIVGKEDKSFLEDSKLIDQLIPNSQLVILENCAHFPFVEKPEEFIRAILEFLKTN